MRGCVQARRIHSTSATFAGKLRLLVLPLVVAAFLAPSVAPAFAAKTHHLKATFGATFTGQIPGIAVDENSDNVFVVDARLTTQVPRIAIFGPEGGPPSGVNPAEIGNLTNPIGVAVDNSAISPSKGAVYVVENGGSVVKRFVLEAQKYKVAGELVATPSLGQVVGIAVDKKGNVFVADNTAKVVVEFSPTGTELARIDVSASVGAPSKVAVDSAGDIILISAQDGSVFRFGANASGEVEAATVPVQIVAPAAPGAPRASGLAVDLGTDALYVAMQSRVDQYSAACTPEGIGSEQHCSREGYFGTGILTLITGVAVNSETGDLHVADEGGLNAARPRKVTAHGPTVIVPEALTSVADNVGGTSATLTGTVNPSGSLVSECKFEWGLTESYGGTTPCAETPVQIGAGEAPVSVHAQLTGLGLGTEYHFRLVGTNANTVPGELGPAIGLDENFTTLGPRVISELATGITDTAARIEGLVNPVGQDTTYVVEYVSGKDFEQDEWAKALSVPIGGEAIGSANENVKVAQQLGGLVPSTVYHFRISATNHCNPDPEDECTAHGPGGSFTTYADAFTDLPDERAYEQVTPLDKNGAAPTGNNGTIQAASDGQGFIYISRGGIPGAVGAQKYPIYLASRNADWSTQGLLPPASAGSVAALLGWSEDLSRAYVVQAVKPGDPVTLLERESATHSLRTIIDEGGINLGESFGESFNYVGASTNGAFAFFEVEDPVTKVVNAYVWNRANGAVTLAGILPNGSVPPKGSHLGSNETLSRRHYTEAQHTVSSDASRVFFTDVGTGRLYVRKNPTKGQSALAGGVCTEPAKACTLQVSASQGAPDPKGPKPAVFTGATSEGSKAFFTSAAKLTDDATTGPNDEGNDLYRYDVESGDLTDLTPDPIDPSGADVRGVLGISGNGSYVYFAANGVLTNAPNARGESASLGNCSATSMAEEGGGSGVCNLYLWHDGVVTFIAPQQQQAQYAASDSANWLSALGTAQVGIANTARVAPDGQTLLFRSQLSLTTYDNGGIPEFYRFSTGDEKVLCVSCDPSGAAPSGPATFQSLKPVIDLNPFPAAILSRNLSTSGDRVFFETPSKLVAQDINGEDGCPLTAGFGSSRAFTCQDVYEWEADGTGSCHSKAQNGGCLYLLSTGTSPEASYFGDASLNGDDAFLFTEQQVVGQDHDQIFDIYDARVHGGIASQNPPPPPPPCLTPEACGGPVPPPPTSQSPGSASFSGPGNQKPPRHKKKKKPHHKKKRHKKQHSTRKHG
jgi:hypothetical protein